MLVGEKRGSGPNTAILTLLITFAGNSAAKLAHVAAKSDEPTLLLAGASVFWLQHPGAPRRGHRGGSAGQRVYPDLTHVWKRAPNGTRSIAVRNVHTHELYLDAADNLYGEHFWCEGDATKKWGPYQWCLRATGRLVKISPDTEGFLRDYGFARDAQSVMY